MAMAITTVPAAFLAEHSPASFYAPGLTEAAFLALFEQFPDSFLEYTADGTVLIIPGKDPESSALGAEVAAGLANWAQTRGGHVAGADALFVLSNGAWRGPDASWFDDARWQSVKTPETSFPVFAPDFAIEVRSPDQRIGSLREKMVEYIQNGVKLGWLIDPMERTVTIYRPDRKPEVLANPKTVAGEGPVEGFVLDLEQIF